MNRNEQKCIRVSEVVTSYTSDALVTKHYTELPEADEFTTGFCYMDMLVTLYSRQEALGLSVV